MAENQAKSTPARVLLLFALLLAAVAVAVSREHAARSAVESVDYPTALGDEAFAPSSLLAVGQVFSAKLDGTDTAASLAVTSAKPLAKAEERLWKVGLAEMVSSQMGHFYIYQSDQTEDTAQYIKSAPGMFYKVTGK
jgi:hypothetical protein